MLGFSVVSIASAIFMRLCMSNRGLGDGGAGGWVGVCMCLSKINAGRFVRFTLFFFKRLSFPP